MREQKVKAWAILERSKPVIHRLWGSEIYPTKEMAWKQVKYFEEAVDIVPCIITYKPLKSKPKRKT